MIRLLIVAVLLCGIVVLAVQLVRVERAEALAQRRQNERLRELQNRRAAGRP